MKTHRYVLASASPESKLLFCEHTASSKKKEQFFFKMDRLTAKYANNNLSNRKNIDTQLTALEKNEHHSNECFKKKMKK